MPCRKLTIINLAELIIEVNKEHYGYEIGFSNNIDLKFSL
jgi:hypothetical protein